MLTYHIRFQNTGTYHATNVVIVDTLATDMLDLNTLSFVGSSHPCVLEVVEGNVLKAHFNGIMLPDSNANEPASHGYVTFRIGLVEGLADGTVISNNAGIYFDYNEPVITNEAFVTLDYNLSAEAAATQTTSFDVFPVPADGVFTLVSEPGVEYRYQVHDATGRTLLTGLVFGMTEVNAENLSNGIYTVRLAENPGVVKKIMIIRP
jgi:uncharacterized repeat protein (TIGR01451 family)